MLYYLLVTYDLEQRSRLGPYHGRLLKDLLVGDHRISQVDKDLVYDAAFDWAF